MTRIQIPYPHWEGTVVPVRFVTLLNGPNSGWGTEALSEVGFHPRRTLDFSLRPLYAVVPQVAW